MVSVSEGCVVVFHDECISYSIESHLPVEMVPIHPRLFPEISLIELSWGLMRRTHSTEEIQIYDTINVDESNLIVHVFVFLRRAFWQFVFYLWITIE
jgi:hypothetical protein